MNIISNLPWPMAEIIRQSEVLFSTQWLMDILPLMAKALEWSFIYLIGAMGCGYGYILFFVTVHYMKYRSDRNGLTDTMISHMCAAATGEKKANNLSRCILNGSYYYFVSAAECWRLK